MIQTTRGAIPTQRMSTEEHTRLETLHGELLHDAAALDASGNRYDASVARARAAFLGRLLGWGSA